MSSRRRAPKEGGFTLIEIVIATAITGIVTAAVAGMLSAFILNAGATTVRLSQSHDAQSAAAYFAQDVDSIGVRNWADDARPSQQSVETAVAYNAGLYPCGAAGTPTALVRMAWNDFDPATPATPKLAVAAYVVEPTGPSGISQLHRILCQGGVRKSDQVLVAALGSAAPVVCTPSPCTANPPPTAISLTLTIHDARNQNPDYTLTLSGHRRQT